VGACAALNADDVITSTHRGHGHLIAKRGESKYMMAELAARSNGYCGGKGGSLHMTDFDLEVLGANGIVAGGLPIATGAALAFRMRGEKSVAVSFFGDGAVNEGAFHEAANLAGLWKLPVIFFCENNLYGEGTPQHKQAPVADLSIRAEGYGFPGATQLLIEADAGGSNSYRSRVWKRDLQEKVADAFGLTVTVCHYPTGTSKWNPIEHRLFSEISKTWGRLPFTLVR
jgi:hypothetical protein